MSMILPQLGFHYYPDERHFTEQDWAIWGPRLNALGAQWLTLRSSLQRAIPESFLKSVLQANIEPIIHIPAAIEALDKSNLQPLLAAYARWGVRYVVVLDRPNAKSQWRTQTWSRRDLVERFLDVFLPILEAEQSLGLTPILPPLEPAGDYWDTAFLEGCLLALSRRAKETLRNGLSLALYAWTYDRPLDWGAGGQGKWIETQPYHTPEGSQDQLGLRIPDWYEGIARKILGHPLPMLIIAGGPGPDFSLCPANSDANIHQATSIYRSIEMGAFTPSLKAFCFYLLACDPSHPDHSTAWYSEIDRALPVVRQFQQLHASDAKLLAKVLSHYVLLPKAPDFSEIAAREDIEELMRQSKPVLGFSPSEARFAEKVTILANEVEIPTAIEAELKSAGCIVERISDAPPADKGIPQNYLDYFISAFAGEKHA